MLEQVRGNRFAAIVRESKDGRNAQSSPSSGHNTQRPGDICDNGSEIKSKNFTNRDILAFEITSIQISEAQIRQQFHAASDGNLRTIYRIQEGDESASQPRALPVDWRNVATHHHRRKNDCNLKQEYLFVRYHLEELSPISSTSQRNDTSQLYKRG